MDFASAPIICVIIALVLLAGWIFYRARNARRTSSSTQRVSDPFFKPKGPTKMNVDQLLDKISEQGMDSLTAEERAFLKGISDKHRRRAESKAPESELLF